VMNTSNSALSRAYLFSLLLLIAGIPGLEFEAWGTLGELHNAAEAIMIRPRHAACDSNH
jgi:hypothetical protein